MDITNITLYVLTNEAFVTGFFAGLSALFFIIVAFIKNKIINIIAATGMGLSLGFLFIVVFINGFFKGF